MIIETMGEWNEALAGCGCCPMPTVGDPTMICESISADFTSNGFTNPEDTEFKIYKKKGTEIVVDSVGSSSGEDTSGATLVFQTRETHLMTFDGEEYPALYFGEIGNGLCEGYPETFPEPACEAVASSFQNGYENKYWGGTSGPPAVAPTKVYGLSNTLEITVTSAEGEETEAHIAWEEESAAWDAAHPDYEAEIAAHAIALAAWNIENDAYQAAVAAYNIAYDEWFAGGEIGDPPTEPAPIGDAPVLANPRPEEPEAVYGPCIFRIERTNRQLAHSFGYLSTDGSPAGEDQDPVVITLFEPIEAILDEITLIQAGDTGAVPTEELKYEDSLTRDGWVALVNGVADGRLVFPNAECAEEECEARYYASPGIIEMDPPIEDVIPESITLEKTNVRYRWRVPTDYVGSFYKVTWDVIEEPDGWDASPPTATRSFFLEDQEWEWTGPGDAEDPESETWLSGWYALPPPSVNGSRRVVNIRYEAYRSTRLGMKPFVAGEGVEL